MYARSRGRVIPLRKRGLAWFLGLSILCSVTPWADVTGPAPISFPLRINCGGEACTSQAGQHYEADTPYQPDRGYGFMGGEPFAPYRYLKVGGTPSPQLYLSERTGDFTYRVDLPPGRYIVTLRLAPMLYHGPGLGRFGIRVGSHWLDEEIDLNARGPRCYAQDIRGLLQCDGAPLRIEFVAVQGSAEVAAIEIQRAPEPLPALSQPRSLEARFCPGGVCLHWDSPPQSHVRGFEVRRALEGDDSFLPLPRPANLACFHWDTTAGHECLYRYRVAAVDPAGKVGPFTESDPVAALPISGSCLPTFSLRVDPDSLRWMCESVFVNRWAPAALTTPEGATYEVRARIRGGVSRYFQKKSFKIRFADGVKYNGRSILNLIWKVDPTYIREALGYEMFRRAGVPACRTSFLHLVLNGETQGVYLNIEQIDDEFLAARGFDPEGSLYEVEGGNMELLENPWDYARDYDKKTGDEEDVSEIIDLVELVNLTSAEEFPGAIWDALDVQGFLDWYSIIVLIANRDVTRGNHYFYLNPASGKWKIFPWDNDLAFPECVPPQFSLDLGAEGSQPMIPMGPNKLITRILAVDGFRYLYATKLDQHLSDILAAEASAKFEALVDSLFDLVREDGLRDRLKVTWEDNGAFLRQAALLREYAVDRSEYVREQLWTLGRPAGSVRINEIQRGETEGASWIELWNGGNDTVRVEELLLADRPIPGFGWRLADGVIPPGGYYLVGLGSQVPGTDGWVAHEITREDRCLALYHDSKGERTLLDVASWPAYLDSGTIGRIVDGAISWICGLAPTPGRANRSPLPSEVTEPVQMTAFPNPCKGTLTVECLLMSAGAGRLDVFDVQGRHVRTLHDGPWRSVLSRVAWDGTSAGGTRVSPGVYFLRLSGPRARTTMVTRMP